MSIETFIKLVRLLSADAYELLICAPVAVDRLRSIFLPHPAAETV